MLYYVVKLVIALRRWAIAINTAGRLVESCCLPELKATG